MGGTMGEVHIVKQEAVIICVLLGLLLGLGAVWYKVRTKVGKDLEEVTGRVGQPHLAGGGRPYGPTRQSTSQ